MKLKNYLLGHWTAPSGEGVPQYNAVTGEVISVCGSEGIDFAEMMEYGRRTGGPALRKMTFQERGLMLKNLALMLNGIKEKYYPISLLTGATRTDSWFDIDGGIGNLFSYSSLRRKFPDSTFYVDGDGIPIGKGGTFMGHHIMTPKRGIAVHINAYNFPVWGMLEKIAVNLLAGVPAVVKPAEQTSFLAQAVAEDIIASGILPEGALQIVCGPGHGILDGLTSQDVVTFTGSASTGRMLKALPAIIENSVPFNLEADSLNAAVLGPDAVPGTPEFDLFVKEVRKEITLKAGQRCTAIRRAIVPHNLVEEVRLALTKQLQQTVIGDPRDEKVRMGALVSRDQVEEVRSRILELTRGSEIVYGDLDDFEIVGADKMKGAFLPPVVLFNDDPFHKQETHLIEAFGPVTTLVPYRTLDEAVELANMGKGSLVCTLVTDDERIARDFTLAAAPFHGRIHILNGAGAKESTGHGSPLPLLTHGGPGRAGGGEEMGGTRGVMHYLQRTAVQGHPDMVTAVTNVYQYGARKIEKAVHPFQQYFEDLEIGETLVTAKHTVTETDIINFANVSGDNFYAHVDATSLEGTIFERRVAHGYWILSKAAGLFVDARKGPVLLNYGIDECRFTKPVYPGMTIGVRLTVREKISQEKKDETDVPKGIVKWLVDVYDETGETVALVTILTMVRMKG